jgi:hypothetical protein
VWRLCKERHGASYCAHRERFRRLSAFWRGYAFAVFRCEKGDRPGDHSGFIYRAEWSPPTARKAGLRHGYPNVYEEALAVVRWTKVVGFHVPAGWPHCP